MELSSRAGARFRRHHIVAACCICFTGFLFLLSWQYLYEESSWAVAWPHRISTEEQEVQSYDFKDTESERECLAGGPAQSTHVEEIPRVVHFIWALRPTGVNLDFLGYLAIRAALVSLHPVTVKLHHTYFNQNEDNKYWQLLKDDVTLVHHEPASENMHDAHMADVLRLDILKKEGGIYMDTDSYALRPFDTLLNSTKDLVLGHEGGNRWGLCNAIIVARKEAAFLHRWIDHYDDFDAAHDWNYHSVILPKQMASEHPSEVCALSPTTFFWPTWSHDHIRYMHDELSAAEAANVQMMLDENNGVLYPNQLAYHAWNQLAAPRTRRLNPDKVRTQNTRFNMLMRRFLAPVDSPAIFK